MADILEQGVLVVFRIMFVIIRVFRELDRYSLAQVLN